MYDIYNPIYTDHEEKIKVKNMQKGLFSKTKTKKTIKEFVKLRPNGIKLNNSRWYGYQ
jgi:hypothetical protein